MNRSLFLLLLISALCGRGIAQEKESSLLWEISGKGLRQPSYLFGTFHLLCKADFSISPVLAEKIKNCRQFYGELKMDDPALQTKLLARSLLKDTTLLSLFPEKDYGKLSEAFQQITGMPLLALNHFKPFLCFSLLTQKTINCADKVQPETELVSFAKQCNLLIGGLESVDDQMDAIDKEPLDSQALSLKRILFNFDSAKTTMAQMVSVYKQRDIDSLYRFMKSNGMEGNFEKELLSSRNEKWAPKIAMVIQQQPAFFAIGAGHLGGSEGVIALLRKKGYTIRPVSF